MLVYCLPTQLCYCKPLSPQSGLAESKISQGCHRSYHPTQVNIPHLNPSQWRLVLDLPTPNG